MNVVDGITPLAVAKVISNIGSHYKKECDVLWGQPHEVLIRESVNISERSFTMVDPDGSIAGIGGVGPMPLEGIPGHCIWFIGTDLMDSLRGRKGVWKACIPLMEDLRMSYYRMSNFCLADPVHERSLEKMGFEIYETENENVRYLLCVS